MDLENEAALSESALVESFDWSDKYSVGVPELDRQHQQIIALINRLIALQNVSVSSEVISETLDSMMRYTTEHLNYEENLLQACSYPAFDTHKALHITFLKQTTEFCMDTMKNKDSVPRELLQYLKAWWQHHILEEDKQYSPYLSKE